MDDLTIYELFYDFLGVTEKAIVPLLLLLWLLFWVSKWMCRKTFQRGLWENGFVFLTGFPTLALILYAGLRLLTACGWGSENLVWYWDGILSGLAVDYLPLLSLFFIIYLIGFLFRLIVLPKEGRDI